MFRAFRLEFREDSDADLQALGRSLHEIQSRQVRLALKKYIKSDGSLSGADVMSDWFGEVEADVFISHSHADEAKAFQLAGLLREKFGLTAFIDSAVWGNYPDLLKIIDDEFSILDPKQHLYSYTRCMRSSAHVHMMLATSLMKMIDRCEAIFFLATPQSISSEEAVENTKSPWIYLELELANSIQIRAADEHRLVKKSVAEDVNFSTRSLTISYPAKFDRFTNLGAGALLKWQWAWNGEGFALDLLYSQHPVNWQIKSTNGNGR